LVAACRYAGQVANRAPRFLFTDHERVKNPLQAGILPHNYVLLS
jgi:hypothetical protein